MTKDDYINYVNLAVKANEKMYKQMAHDEARKAEARGKTEGIALGEIRGEDKEKVATARKMKQYNESLDKIKLYTGLSTEKIKSI